MAELNTLSLLSDANLVAYWKLEDANSTKGVFNLTNNGTTTFTSAKFSNGANFGTSNSTKSLSISSNLGINGESSLTISCWVKLTTEISSGNYCFVLVSSNGGTDNYLKIIYEYNTGTRRLRLGFGATAGADYNTTLGTTDFYHLVATRSGSNYILYVNGTNVANVTNAATFTLGDYTSIGAQITGSGAEYSSVLVDDVAIFSRALTAAEVLQLYNNKGGALFFAQY